MNSIQYSIWIFSVNKFHVSRVTNLKTLRWCLPSWHPLANTHSRAHARTHTGAYSQVNELAKVAVAVAPAMQRKTELKESKGTLRANIPKRDNIVNRPPHGQVLLFHTCIIFQLSFCAVHAYQAQDEKKVVWLYVWIYYWIYVCHDLKTFWFNFYA